MLTYNGVCCHPATQQVCNSGGTIESSAALDIHTKVQESTEEDYPPGFTSTLEDHSVTEGAPVQYSCRVKGQPAPDVAWFLDGTELKHGDQYKISSKDDNQLLVILAPKLSQSGTIVCQVDPQLPQSASAGCTVSPTNIVKLPKFAAETPCHSFHRDGNNNGFSSLFLVCVHRYISRHLQVEVLGSIVNNEKIDKSEVCLLESVWLSQATSTGKRSQDFVLVIQKLV